MASFVYYAHMRKLNRAGALLLLGFAVACFADDQPDSAVSKARKTSSLTGPGAEPFHLKLTVSEPANGSSPYSATMEEYWESEKNWVRSIDSPVFRQRIVVKDGTPTEETDGDYYPIWLRMFVTAAVDPLQDSGFWEKVSARIVINPPIEGHRSTSCARAQFKIGTAAVNNDAFAVICFNSDGTLESVVRPGFDMEFKAEQPFGKKRIAFRYVTYPEPGTELVGRVDILEKIDRKMTLPVMAQLKNSTVGELKSIAVSQDTFEKLSHGPIEIHWPTVHSGNTKGKLSMYVSVDRDGTVREAYPLNSDNAGLQDAARDQLVKIRVTPADIKGQRVQVEAALTFQFETSLAEESKPTDKSNPAVADAILTNIAESGGSKPIVVSPAIANALRLKAFAPVYPLELKLKRVGGTVKLLAVIGRQGQIVSLTPLESPNEELTKAATAAVEHWVYKPYLLNGAPVEIQTPITVIFQAP